MTFRKVNILIILLAIVIFLLVLHHNLLGLSDFLKKEDSDSGPLDALPGAPGGVPGERRGMEIPVVVTAVEERLGGVIAAMNSISTNTKSNVVFYIVTMNNTVDHLRMWLKNTGLKTLNYKIVDFDPRILEGKIRTDPEQPEPLKPLTFARYYLPYMVPDAEKAIYVDDDIIVQGDPTTNWRWEEEERLHH